MESKLILIKFLNEFDFERTEVPLRLHCTFLYEPIEEDLIRLTIGGMQIQWSYLLLIINIIHSYIEKDSN